MDKYEYRVKTEQMLEHMEHRRFKKAMEIADTIDWRRVKNPAMLNSVSEIYEYNGEFQKGRDVLFLAYDRAPNSRKTIYRLGTLALKINDIEEASDCYEEFVKIAPKDPNQYILKYKILKARRAPLAEQIDALEEFKKAEYIEKWAYELAKLYDEAGMTAECLEECDDLILWFSEGTYVYQAMELKMKYKPLTPLQQEKYNSYKNEMMRAERAVDEDEEEESVETASEEPVQEAQTAPEETAEEPAKKAAEESAEDIVAKTMAEITRNESPKEVTPKEIISEEASGEKDRTEEAKEAKEAPAEEQEGRKVRSESNIRKAVKGATLAEALRNGIAVANGVDIERKAIDKKDEDLRITGQMKIEEILQEWEAKQKENAQAIASQKQKDEEILAQKRLEAEKRREEEARRIEEQQRAAEEARRIAEQKAAEEARRLAARKAEEERLLAEQRAEEERRQAILKAEEEERILERLAAEKAAKELDESRKAQQEEVYEEEEPEDAYEEEELEEAYEEVPADEEDFEEYEEDILTEEAEEYEEDLAVAEEEAEEYEEEASEEEALDEYEEDSADYEADLDEFDEEEADYDEDFELDDDTFFSETKDSVESGGMTEDLRKLMEELEAGQTKKETPEVEEFHGFFDDEEVEAEEDEPDYEEDFGDDAEEDEPDYEEDDGEDYEVGDEEELPQKAEELTIEEPTEEEIQKRIKKGKGGVPFDTGFVVTGRYDLSATSEIGLRAGLTEEQKKLFSYFVPVRGMSEQIVEVLDNDRREKREGTSRTGNIIVIGQKGSGKTVLAVDIVKAIQKQRNLKQGKVAIVTGESLNKKELTSIFKKLRGGAIIVEKAGKLNARTVKELDRLMEKKTGELLFVLEDQRKPLEKLFTANPRFKKKFTSRLELPVFINDELVTFGQTYAKENGYKLDEMGILALYSRIDIMQREDHSVTVAEVKEIMDEAIDHSQKANVKHFARRVFGKGTDDADRIILKEDDFRI